MERAPLRPVPGRPSGPVSDAEAVALVAAAVPALGERDGTVLALAAFAGTPRPQLALRLGIGADELAQSLARARKELRRTLAALPGSGWCELAERLISDRIDDALAEPDEPRLAAHLRNCPRCVEHERRLVQATDALVESVGPAPGPRALAPAAPAPGAKDPPDAALPVRAVEATAPPGAAAPVPAVEATPAAVPTRRPRRELASALSWNLLIVIAVVLALASLGLALAGALGAQL
jgi:hypothetical protein